MAIRVMPDSSLMSPLVLFIGQIDRPVSFIDYVFVRESNINISISSAGRKTSTIVLMNSTISGENLIPF